MKKKMKIKRYILGRLYHVSLVVLNLSLLAAGLVQMTSCSDEYTGGVFVGQSTYEGAEVVDAYIDYSTVKEIPTFSWGGSEAAFSRLSLKDGCLHFHSEEAVEPSWECQFFPIGGVKAEIGTVYTLHYKIKGTVAQNVSMLGFGQTPWGEFPITTEWVEGTVDYLCTSSDGNILMQCGDYIGDWDIAYLKITHREKYESAEWVELLSNGNAEQSWESLGLADVQYNDLNNNYKVCFWAKEKGVSGNVPFPADIITESDGNHAFVCHTQLADTEGNASAWDNQIWLQSPRQWQTGEKFKISFRYKASRVATVTTEVHRQTPSDHLYWEAIGNIDFTTKWQTFETIVTVSPEFNGMWSIAFNLNAYDKNPVVYYIDDISWSESRKLH